MKIPILSFFFLVLCSDSWAQLTCTNCTVTVNGAILEGTLASPATILSSPGTFEGNIVLTGDCLFTVTGTGNYTLSGQITGTGTVTYNALNVGVEGKEAGVTLSGSTSNTYIGQTTISRGYLIGNKTNAVAVPGNLKISATAGDKSVHVWCLSDNQLGTASVVDFSDAQNFSFFHLNGTTQTIAGIKSNNSKGVVENRETIYVPSGMTTAQLSANPALLNIAGGSTPCVFGGGAYIRKGIDSSPAFTMNVISGTQIIQNPNGNINNVTFTSATGAMLEFNTTNGGSYSVGGGVAFKGEGLILKTGAGEIATYNSTLLKPAGQIRVSGGILRNNMANNIYANSTESNKAELQVDANAVFDIWGNVSIFDGLTGGGVLRNNWGDSDGSLPGGGYSWLTLGQNNSSGSPVFDGVIQDNSSGNQVSATGHNTGGIALKKVGTGIQVLKGANRYTGRTTVSSGTLKLQDGGQLGRGIYGGALEISNVAAAASQATFEHNGTQPQIFNGSITNTGEGGTKGIFLQSGSGKSIINGVNAFTGQVNITGGFLGGSGSLKNAAGVTVGANASIGGGDGVAVGGTLTVTGLSLAAGSKLVVTSTTNNAPSLVWVKDRTSENQGTIAVAGVFTVDLLSANLVNGRIIGCSNGSSGNHPLPVIGQNNTGKPVTFMWGIDGLYVNITPVSNGLACNNCTFISSGETKTGTSASPALILNSPGTFTGTITLNGDCSFTIIGAGNYTLSGQIAGSNHSLTLNAPGTATTGYTAGFIFGGENANSYGSTTINSGYIICNKSSGVLAIPGHVKLAGSGVQSHLWCLADNQLSENTVVDFTATTRYSYFDLNGTTQTIAGLVANTDGAVVENYWDNTSHPAGMTNAQVRANAATLNIQAGSGSYTYGGGAYIRKGGTGAAALTVNVMSGTQIIQNPNDHTNNVTLTTAAEATLEFNTNSGTYVLGGGVIFRGAGIIKKTGSGTIAAAGATYLKTAGKIWVSEGIWKNQSANNRYAVGNESNKATLQVDAPNATFDLMSDASIFGGLAGGGWVRNNWGYHGRDGYTDFTLNQSDTTSATFAGIIQNNSSNGSSVSGNGDGTGGIRLKKGGNGTQVLTGVNTYTGSTTVSAGTLKLGEGGKLGGGTYGGVLEIANVSEAASQATFEHAGTQLQIFTGNMTNTGAGITKGIFLQSGGGKSIINGATAKSFTGQVNITGGFLGGSGSLKNATAVNVGAGGSIGGGTGVALGGDTLTVSSLSFAAGSKLIVSTTTGNHKRPGVVKVETSAGAPGPVTIATGGFTVNIVGTDVAGGYILRCSNGVGLPLPVLGQHSFPVGTPLPSFRWDDQGLYMETSRGLTCNNCTFGSGSAAKTGTPENPAFILRTPGTYIGNITLNGDCQFTITGIGNYTLPGPITGTGSLTYIANTREEVPNENGASSGAGHSAGVTLTGNSPNTYTGLTTIQSGYLICIKNNNVASVPHNLKISARADGPPAKIWFFSDNEYWNPAGNNQLGGGSTIVDFTDTGNDSYFHLNGTTQTIAGLKANNNKVTVHNHADRDYRPTVAGWGRYHTTQGVSYMPPGTLNINTGNNSCTFGGGATMMRGFFGTYMPPPDLIMNVTGGTQILENPTTVSQTDLRPAGSATLELKTTTNALYQMGGTGNNVVTLKGDGTIKKTGPGTIAMAHFRVLKPGGKIWVFEGTLRNEGTPIYTTATATTTESNKAVLEVEAPSGSNNPTFDIYGNHSIFGGLAGGGRVQNNWGPSSDGGYNYLTLNRSNTATSTFSGIIRDNSSNNQVAAGTGTGGISLKKEGNGTQALTGANLYTGTTTVSAGTLKLQGDGRLGTMNAGTYTATYGGALEISNVAAAASQATFEHNGTQAQVFTGNMTNTGEGSVKGIFLQSGSGKSIINGVTPKSFTGHVNITGGFLGGSGDLRNATAVTVGAEGSIGGGDKVAATGDTLTVSNLTFAAATSKLIVTSTSASTPGLSLVNVRTSTGAGTIAATAGFTVEVVGTNLVNGYILKCSNGTGLPIPTLVLPANSTMEGKVRLTWDSQGLWMQTSVGTITLSSASSVCPKGTNPDNPSITVTATYSHELDLPLSGSPSDYFTLSNPNAKSGTIHVTRVGNVVTAVFDGANTTTADLSYTITYDDNRNLAVTGSEQKINRQPTLSTSPGGNSVCLGASLVLQAAGNGTVTISSSNLNKATVGAISATLSATVTPRAPGHVNFWAADGTGCKSNYLTLVVNALPVIGPLNPAVCVGGLLTLIADRDPATTSAWVLSPATSTAASLEALTPPDGKKINFHAGTTAQNVTVEYTDHQGCKATTSVTISTVLTLTPTSTSPICTGTATDILLNPSLSHATYTWTVSENSVGAQAQTVAVSSNRMAQTLTNSGGAPVTVTYSVTGTSGTCVRTVHIAVGVSHTQGVKPTVTGGGQYCVGTENNTYQTNLTPSAAGTNVTWTYTSSFPKNQMANVISGKTQKLAKGTLTEGAVKDNLVLSANANAPAEVYYVFRPFIGCLGIPSDTVRVKLHPIPVAGAVPNSAICSSSAVQTTTTNIALSSTTADVRYTWMVDKVNAPGVTGFSEPSRNGAVVPTNNPAAAISGPIADHLVLVATATSAQTITYRITPWYAGCPGQVVSTNVLVNPLPVVNKPADRLYCSGAEVVAASLTGTHGANLFKWSGGVSAGLADQAVYASGLPAYTAPTSGQYVGPVEVKISAKNAKGCESASEVSFTLSVKAKPSVTLGTSRALCTGLTVETAAQTRIGVTPTATKYKWKARAEGASAGDIKIIQEGTARSFPLDENTLQEGDIVKKMTAPAGSVTIVTFDVRPFLAECAGDEVSTTVQVSGRDLTAGIVNNSPGICSGSAANIKVGEAEDGNTYSWASLDNSGKVQGHNQQTERRAAATISDVLTLTGNKQSNVTYTITPSRGDCDGALVSYTVFVNPLPVLTVSSSTSPICIGEKTAISLLINLTEPESNAVTYSWQMSDNTLGVLSSVTNQTSFEQQTLSLVDEKVAEGSVTYTFTPFYTPSATLSCEGQPGIATYTVVRLLVATIDTTPVKACLGDQITLTATPVGSSFLWLKDATLISDVPSKSYVVPTNAVLEATYAVRITNVCGSSESGGKKVKVTQDAYFNGAEVEGPEKGEGETSKPVKFIYTAPNVTDIEYNWDFKDNTPVDTVRNPSHTYLKVGTYHPTLKVTKLRQSNCFRDFELAELKIKEGVPTGDPNNSGAFSVYPVPAQDRLTIVNDGGDLQNITIRDISGKTVMSEAVHGRKATLSIAHFTNGIYLLTVTDSKGVKHMKISKN